MKLLKSKNTVNLYFIATILRNAHCCLYEGLTASYFNCLAPTLEDYFERNNPKNEFLKPAHY